MNDRFQSLFAEVAGKTATPIDCRGCYQPGRTWLDCGEMPVSSGIRR